MLTKTQRPTVTRAESFYVLFIGHHFLRQTTVSAPRFQRMFVQEIEENDVDQQDAVQLRKKAAARVNAKMRDIEDEDDDHGIDAPQSESIKKIRL